MTRNRFAAAWAAPLETGIPADGLPPDGGPRRRVAHPAKTPCGEETGPLGPILPEGHLLARAAAATDMAP